MGAKLKEEGKDFDEEESSSEEEEDSDDDLPRECPCCDLKWEECSSIPIVTICGHHFCEDCAMTNYAKTPKCMTCGSPTNGMFNSCDQIEAKIKAKKEAKAERAREAKLKAGKAVPWQVHQDT